MAKGGAVRDENYSRATVKNSVILKRLGRYLYSFKWLLLTAILLCVAGNLLALVGPKLSGLAIDSIELESGVDFQGVFKYAGLMIICYAASAGINFALSALMIKLSRSVVYKMRKDVFDKLVSLPVGFFDRHQTGDVISVISYDIDTVNASLSTDLVQLAASVITVIGSLVMMLTISPKLILIFAATIPASILFTRYRSRKVRPLYRKRSGKLGEMNGFVEEMTGGLKSVKAYGRENEAIAFFDAKNEAAVESNFAADHFSAITGPAVNFINNMSLALISMLGGLLYLAGGITLGNISSFVLYSRKFSGPINEFANIISDIQSALAAAERVFRLIDQEPEKQDGADAVELCDVYGSVVAENICFGYEPDARILHDISFSADSGKVVAIVGPTGCGKTTLINLLMRFYDTDSGSLCVDGRELTSLTRASLRRAYTMVLQDSWLFYGTIFDNIAYGKEGVTLEEVQNAARAARMHNYIMSLPQGYNTLLSDNAVNISKGQKQLLTIARAMLIASPMLILDEATSNVDSRTERQIQAAMLTLMQGRTCFVIAHRLSTIRNADVILVMQKGRIVERGSHEELMAQRGSYYELYHSQFDSMDCESATMSA